VVLRVRREIKKVDTNIVEGVEAGKASVFQVSFW